MMIGKVEAVLVGRVAALGEVAESGMDKHPVSGPVMAEPLGLAGDQQADLRVHGGPDKAVHVYPAAHYAFWQTQVDSPLLARPGAFGENLSVSGLVESDVFFGDVWQIGSARFEVSQGRQPCWKLNLRFGVTDMAQQVQNSLKVGWYLRVLEPGNVQAGDEVELLARPYPDWSIERIMRVFYRDGLNVFELEALLALPLPPSWHRTLQKRLASGELENWQPRLFGH
ncbi:MOSC domain-containing protein [Thiomicrospira sp. S5]|uniref:MOSC domain-containing protein n=1 Tax=Thiomicrospira sp. S5 TaxID=1803865 RepID=UPI00197EB00D|nr:MOSC domain-containing protein [Thiomicrospira sp. S5]